MPQKPNFNDFIDDELLRAPMTFDRALDAVLERWRLLSTAGYASTQHRGDRLLQHYRGEVVATALKQLRQSCEQDLRLQREGDGGRSHAPLKRELSLIEDDDVAVDIEIARAIELAKVHAEAELRELQTFTSALVGDHNVARDTNPFRPEVMVHALWRGAQTMPLSRLGQVSFLRDLAQPQAEALRVAYRGAVQRLIEQGIEPAAHRTIVFHGSAWGKRLAQRLSNEQMGALVQTVDARPPGSISPLSGGAGSSGTFGSGQMPPVPRLPDLPHAPQTPPLPQLQLGRGNAPPPHSPYSSTAAFGPLRDAGSGPAAPAPRTGPADRLSRLFDTMLRDDALPLELLPLMRRVQPVVVRVAQRDETLLSIHVHPVWRFLDRLAHHALSASPLEQTRLLGLARNLIDHLNGEPEVDGNRFEWASERLTIARRQTFVQALAAAQPLIEKAKRRMRTDMPVTSTMPLDLDALDTVPATLLSARAPMAEASADLTDIEEAEPGSFWRGWLQGEWRILQLLWRDDALGLWLLREPASETHWALRQTAIDHLGREGLLSVLQRRSLVRRAAARLKEKELPPAPAPAPAPTPSPAPPRPASA